MRWITRQGTGRQALMSAALLLMCTACSGLTDLQVDNTNNPDRKRALTSVTDVETLIIGSFNQFFDISQGESAIFGACSSATTNGAEGAVGVYDHCKQPRKPLSNGVLTSQQTTRTTWRNLYRMLSNVYDGLNATKDLGATLSPQAQAYAKFIYGIGWGQVALLYDQGVLIKDDEVLTADPNAQAAAAMRPSKDLLDAALTSLDQAIAIANANTFSFPAYGSSKLWFTTPAALTNVQFAKMANTWAARLLVLYARTPAQRAQVDWARVLAYTAKGLDASYPEFRIQLEQGFRTSGLYGEMMDYTPGCDSCSRLNYMLVGMADTSAGYKNWIAAPVDLRTMYDMVSPDKRITNGGVDGGTINKSRKVTDGLWVRYRIDPLTVTRGTYFNSHYQWARHEFSGTGNQLAYQGTYLVASKTENDLYRAEALVRTGDLAGAVPLINTARAVGGLPAVTTAGVAQSADCVPRTNAGACGGLMTAIRYERILETVAFDARNHYFESRGWGMLPVDSWTESPVPGDELAQMGIAQYTFGGAGGTSSAVYAPTDTP